MGIVIHARKSLFFVNNPYEKAMEGEDPSGELHFLYLDDAGNEQGPFPVSSVVSWVQSGFFAGSRRVKKVDEKGEFVALSTVPELAQYLPLVAAAPAVPLAETASSGPSGVAPQTEEEQVLSEYYRRFYEQAFAKAAADYEAQMAEYTRQQQLLKEGGEKRERPDDGYVVPQPKFEDYRVAGSFSKIHGKFVTQGQGGSELSIFFIFFFFRFSQFLEFRYWLGKGAQSDREGRQLDHYYDVAAFNSAMAAGVVEKNAPDKSKVF